MGQRILRMSDVFLTDLFGNCSGNGWRVKANPLPEDARVVRVFFTPERGQIACVMESVAWPYVKPGDPIPDLEPVTFETIQFEPTPKPFVRPATEATIGPGQIWTSGKDGRLKPAVCSTCKGDATRFFVTSDADGASAMQLYCDTCCPPVAELEPPEVLWFEGGPWKGAFLCPHPVRDVVELPRLAGGKYVYRDAGRRTDDGRRIFEVQISHTVPEPEPTAPAESERRIKFREFL